jgi:hypothetical protein
MLALWWFMLALSSIVFFGYGIILMYHWFSYSLDSKAALTASVLYNGLGCLLILAMAAAALSIQS